MKVQQTPSRGGGGFSLAELMVVIVIIGLLATLVVTNASKFLGSGNKAKVKSDLSTLENALESYAIENGMKFPDNLEVLVQPDESGMTYIKGDRLPLDPWKFEYQYDPPSGTEKARIYTLGRDGQPGGEGDDRDLDTNMLHNGEI